MRAVMSPLLCAILTALLWPRAAFSALPPAATGAPVQPIGAAASIEGTPGSKAGATGEVQGGGGIWAVPVRVRIGGSLSYDLRRSLNEGDSTKEQNMLSTLRASANTFIWEPWIAQVNGNLGISAVRSIADQNDASNTTKNLVLTGGGQLSLLPMTSFPFEVHFDRSDSRVASELVSVEGYSSKRIGFSQQYFQHNKSFMFGWDRSTQDAASSGRDQQDTWRMTASHGAGKHRFSWNGDRSRNTRIRTGESVTMNNLTLQHSYAPAAMLSIENMANISRSRFELSDAENHTDLAQLSSLAFWRSETRPLTISTGVRLLAMEAESSDGTDGFAGMRARNANANVGLTYDLTRALNFNASVNINMTDANGDRNLASNQMVGLNYRPDARKIGEFNYNWSVGGLANNSSDFEGNGTSYANTYLSHSLTRSMNIGEGAWLSVDFSQSFSAAKTFGAVDDAPSYSRQISHSAGASWSRSQGAGSAMVRLSASDSRSLDGSEDYFQLINLQASSNLMTSGYTSWNGSFTVQATRQGQNNMLLQADPTRGTVGISFGKRDEFVTTSSGGVAYQNSRLLGVRRLQFGSELRMNSNALLPLFNGPQDQEMAAWQNRLDYSIGRTQLRVNTMLSRIKQPVNSNAGSTAAGSRTRLNKAIMFSATRSFGSL